MTFKAGRSNPHLLLVEDDADDQRFLQWAIRRSGLPIRVSLAWDGEEAIEFLTRSAERLFLILSDIHLPKKSGWELLQWVRSQSRCARLPVLLWTSLPNPEGEQKALQLGATSYFSKPCTTEGYVKLVGVIADHLRD